ncbi:restriction endonuclease [Vibrio sp. CK2-1]|uniref:restriction endonuclease n=1 Tax=Vibrio sp. CK2-1 TaxID=2912249 RepID=UPI001F00B280|nr:restriction endonuclease [Vibrio sp. CK2-1]MCF7353329.1 restriction endonuclease [Vibrio sp. CK2-1]
MNWKDYEKDIYQQFKDMYPTAEITYDAKVRGRYSKVERQVDILVEDYAAGESITIMVDAKFFGKNIDVKDVESFIGMMQDVGADKGLLITQKGYSKAAIARAHNDPSRIELDILNFDELKKFQGFGALPYSGKHGVILPAPFGWVIDAGVRDGALAALYQRGLTVEEARERNEWMYLNIFSKDKKIQDMDSFLKFHETEVLKNFPDAKIGYQKTVKRDKYKTLIRTIEVNEYPTIEYTGFIDFGDSIFFCVLFTPEELKEKNIKKLLHIISKALPFNVDVESMGKSKINELEFRFEQTDNQTEKAELLIAQGNILMDLEKYDEAEIKFNESIEIISSSYGALKGNVEIKLITQSPNDKLDTAVDNFFELSPTNPTVCQDLMEIYERHEVNSLFEETMLRKLKDFSQNDEAKGNILYHLGLFNQELGKDKEAIANFCDARECFLQSLDTRHMVFEFIDTNLRELGQ